MSLGTFMLALTVGSALLALWIAVRLPRIAPKSGSGLTLALIGTVAVVLAGPAAIGAVGVPLGALAATLLVALPLCTFLFLVAAWIIQYIARLLPPHIR